MYSIRPDLPVWTRSYLFNFIVQNTEVNNVPNVIIIQKANTKSSVEQHGSPTNAKVGPGAMEE
jgi:hypothetical protein